MRSSKIVNLFPGDKTGVESAKKYLDEESLLSYLDDVASRQSERIKPKYCDLARLHFLTRSRKVFKALEFGVGFSTVVIADAILKNKLEYETLARDDEGTDPDKFVLFSLDSIEEWLDKTKTILPKELLGTVRLCLSGVSTHTFNGRICHLYDMLPDIVPDFIYVDGPDPASVQGKINGQSWSKIERPVMSADVLRIESTLLPGTLVVVDGRTANVRFLGANLYRNWSIATDLSADITVMELTEAPLGKKNIDKLGYQLGDRYKDWLDPLISH